MCRVYLVDMATAARLNQSRIPTGRFERVARIGLLAGEMALGGLAEGVKRLSGLSEDASNAFLTVTNAEKLAKRLSTMRGAAMKLGQMLSLEGEDLLPPEFAQALSIMRAEGHAMPDTQLRRVLGHAYGRGWEERFDGFDFHPIAAASIGQVHRVATTDGRDLALKIQYPGVADSIDSDVENLATALRLSRLIPSGIDIRAVMKQTKRQLRLETDYAREAQHLAHYGELLADDDRIVVPAVHHDLTTRKILAMDYVEGRPIDDLASERHDQATRDRVGLALYELLFAEFFEFRFMQTDPNPANYMFQPETGKLILLDLGAATEVAKPLSKLYATIFTAGMNSDRHTMRDAMREVGFFDDDERPECVDGVVELFMLGCEPFRHNGLYDFAESTLPERAREIGMDLTFGKGFFRPPPPKTIFLHRKLGGLFLLCARLGAKVNSRAALQRSLARSPD